MPILGHTGDGNMHPIILTDERKTEGIGRVKQAIHEELFGFMPGLPEMTFRQILQGLKFKKGAKKVGLLAESYGKAE